LVAAFGPSSLGILIVRDLSPSFPDLRHKLLSYSSYLANLPASTLARLEIPAAKWLTGWSCGKETLKDGRYDTLKGSYYVNPAPGFEEPGTQEKLRETYPGFEEYTAANVWPGEDVLPGFEETFRDLCTLITDVAVLVARACDQYAQSNIPDYKPGYLEHVVQTSISTKARLLHYFPPPQSPESTPTPAAEDEDDDDDWCATHLDHGCLTGLTSAMFVDESTYPPSLPPSPLTSPPAPLPELPSSPDPKAGLYIHSRAGSVTKVAIPRDCLAFQTGEALEVITRGKFRAVPHFVRGARGEGQVARNTLAVFTQPNLWEVMDEEGGMAFAEWARRVVEKNH
ncbi:Clavaminate synthase-like protein, partial [Patellaria atrata CBS 101060]